LRTFDQRLIAHFDGLATAGARVWPVCDALLDDLSVGGAFTVAVVALERRDTGRLEHLWGLSATAPQIGDGLDAALLWAHKESLTGFVSSLLTSDETTRRRSGIAACAMHALDPGLTSKDLSSERHASIQARSLQAAGEIGRTDLLSSCMSAVGEEESDGHFWAAWSAVLLGDRSRALSRLQRTATIAGLHRARAFALTLQAMGAGAAHALLKDLAAEPDQVRWLIHGSGVAGDAMNIPWLINQMREDPTARLAGEAFSLITGADLSKLSLDRPQPEGFESGPNDDPDDSNVAMDPDEGLPWPDPDKIEKWWTANASRFHKGTRYFMGAPVTRESCIDVLKNGYQRQRILAAHYLCLLDPGTPLFNTSAPAWRQQRLLARM
jgi:uncharacterized protein (TIGR02270 family)